MTATPNRKPGAERAPKKVAAAKRADGSAIVAPDETLTALAKLDASEAKPVKREAPTALHRESPFGPTGGAIYFNSVTDRWYAQAWITLDGQRRSKTAAARSRDEAYDKLIAIRNTYVLANGEQPAPAPKPRRRTGRRSDADLVFVPGVGTVLPTNTAPAKTAAAKKATKKPPTV